MLFISGYLSEEVFKYPILGELILVIRHSDGPVVWGVAVRVGVGMRFCKIPIDGREFSRQDGTVLTAESR